MSSVKFDGVALGELHVNLLESNFSAKLKLVNRKNGRSYGSMTISHALVTKPIWDKLNELQQVIESEAAKLIFEDGGEESIIDNDSVGLGEFLEKEEPPQG